MTQPQRWSGTFAPYFDTAPGALAKISASASNCLDAYCRSYLSPVPAVDAFRIEWNSIVLCMLLFSLSKAF